MLRFCVEFFVIQVRERYVRKINVDARMRIIRMVEKILSHFY
jgi:hypothetical protein